MNQHVTKLSIPVGFSYQALAKRKVWGSQVHRNWNGINTVEWYRHCQYIRSIISKKTINAYYDFGMSFRRQSAMLQLMHPFQMNFTLKCMMFYVLFFNMNNNELKINDFFGMNGSRRDAYIVTHHHKAKNFHMCHCLHKL